jgi:hypothetical protein
MGTIESSDGDAMYPIEVGGQTGEYALATGEAAAYRLGILHDLYGPGTRRVLLESGVRGGMRVADLGCGVGKVTAVLAELGDGTYARAMVQVLVDRGALWPAGAAALLRQGGPDRARLVADIKRAVLAAAPRDGDQPLDLATALMATRGAVDEAARRMATARNEALAALLADLGDGTPAGDMIQDLVDRGDLPRAVAAGLLRPDGADHAQLKADIKKAVLAAARQNGHRPLRRSTALTAT